MGMGKKGWYLLLNFIYKNKNEKKKKNKKFVNWLYQ